MKRFERLLQLHKDHNATPEEQDELFGLIQSGAFDDRLLDDITDTLLDTSPGLLYTADPIKALIFEKIIQQNIEDGPGNKSDGTPGSSIEATPRIPNESASGLSEGGSWMAIAASLVLAATSSLWVFYGGQQHYANEKHYSGKGIFILPDGTRVTLGDDQSALTYFTEENNRVVKLHGEASFEVEWDRRPFFVQTGKIRTRILGSTFNVRAYTVQTEVPLKPPLDIDPSDLFNNPQSIL
jgi:hypothetical protein